MTINSPLSASLNAVSILMEPAQDPWWIIAGAAVALHGADAGHVSDVDVLLSSADATRILPSIGVGLGRGSEHPLFRSSIFGTWTGTALPVEFMADFHHLAGVEWVPVQPATRQTIAVDGRIVFVPEKAELKAMLTAFGRPKDMDRAQRLTMLP